MERRETKTPAGKEIDVDAISRQIQKVIDDTRGKSGALIRVLQQTQGIVGYLPPPVLKIISRDLKVPLSEVYGIVSFYHFFTMVPRGKYVVQVCLGTSCYVKGGQKLLDTMKKDYNLESEGITPDGKFSLETVRCLGCCGLSPVMAIREAVYRKVKPSDVKDILSAYK